VLLLLSGRVEKISTRDNLFGSRRQAALIGGDAMLDNRPSQHTYRASSFLRVLRLPVGLYTEVIRRNGLLDNVRHVANMRIFLNKTNLFSEGLPVAVLDALLTARRNGTFNPASLLAAMIFR